MALAFRRGREDKTVRNSGPYLARGREEKTVRNSGPYVSALAEHAPRPLDSCQAHKRRDSLTAQGSSLENCRPKGHGGSNPSPSANGKVAREVMGRLAKP